MQQLKKSYSLDWYCKHFQQTHYDNVWFWQKRHFKH